MKKQRKLAILQSSDPDFLELISPYDYSFKEAIKREIPYPDSRWDAEKKVWLIHRAYLGDLVGICEKHFAGIEIESDLTEEGDVGEKLRWLFGLCQGEAERKRLYRTLAFIVHPDRGFEDGEIMKKLNEVYHDRKGV